MWDLPYLSLLACLPHRENNSQIPHVEKALIVHLALLHLIRIHEKFDAHKICRDVAMQRLYKKIRFIFKGNWY